MPYTPSLADLPQSTPTQTAPSQGPVSAGYTPSLDDIPKPSVMDIAGKVADYPIAAVSSLRKGALDAVGDTATLAGNILRSGFKLLDNEKAADLVKKIQDKAGEEYSKFKDKINSNPIDVEAQEKHPALSAISAGTGYVGGAIASQAPFLGPVTSLVNKGLDTAIPLLSKAPGTKFAINQALQSAGLGAGANPEHPLQGAKSALEAAGPFIAVGAPVEARMARAGNILKFETNNVSDAGINPNSQEGMMRISKALKEKGIDYSKYQIQTGITKAITDHLSDIAPDQIHPNGFNYTAAQLASKNYQSVVNEVNEAYKPIIQNQTQFATKNFQQTLQSFGGDLPKLKMTGILPENATLNQMKDFRTRLDQTLSAMKAQVVDGKMIASDLKPYTTLRTAITEDMQQSAAQIGLKDQLKHAENLYETQQLPFNVYNTKSGKLVSHEDVNDAWQRVNKLSIGRNVNPNDLENIQKTLGPDGVKTAAWARIGTAVERSRTDKGLINPKTLHSELKKIEATGISNIYFKGEVGPVVKGIRKILDGADEALRIDPKANWINGVLDKIPSLTSSRIGIGLLRTLGGETGKSALARHILTSLGLGTISVRASKEQQK